MEKLSMKKSVLNFTVFAAMISGFGLFNYGAAQVIIDGNPMSYYDDTTNTYTIQDGDVITVKLDGVTIEGNGANTDVSIIVDDTSVESLTLDGVNYTAPSNVLGLRINNSAADFTLNLTGTNSITGGSEYAGIYNSTSNSLTSCIRPTLLENQLVPFCG